jgi:hypothetical protein
MTSVPDKLPGTNWLTWLRFRFEAWSSGQLQADNTTPDQKEGKIFISKIIQSTLITYIIKFRHMFVNIHIFERS